MDANTQTPTSVLVVDDSPETLDMLTDALVLTGMRVTVAHNGHDALKAVDEKLPDIVLMDAVMAGMDGFETCQILKEEQGFSDVPVIFMTGFSEGEHMARAFASGAVDYVSKPIQLDELFARINVHLSNARKARSAREALDRTGRRIVSCNESGVILWSTPQAAELMNRNGMRTGEGERLPREIIYWLSSGPDTPRIRINRSTGIEFRHLEQERDGEILLRLIDSNEGTEEEQLSKAFQITLREAEVLLWLTHSKSNKEIAQILELSPRTVNKHLEQIFIKLGIENRTAAATKAVGVLWRKA